MQALDSLAPKCWSSLRLDQFFVPAQTKAGYFDQQTAGRIGKQLTESLNKSLKKPLFFRLAVSVVVYFALCLCVLAFICIR
jgi:hypothetical protein